MTTEDEYTTAARCWLLARGHGSQDLLTGGLRLARTGEGRAALVVAAVLAGSAWAASYGLGLTGDGGGRRHPTIGDESL